MKGFMYQVVLSPDEGGAWQVSVPDLPGCFTCGDSREEALLMAADAMRTYVAALLADKRPIPENTTRPCPPGAQNCMVFFETNAEYLTENAPAGAAQQQSALA